MAAVEGRNELRKDAPHKRLLSILVLLLQLLDDPTEISITAVFHVQVQILGRLEVFAVVVADNVGMAQRREDLELGV